MVNNPAKPQFNAVFHVTGKLKFKRELPNGDAEVHFPDVDRWLEMKTESIFYGAMGARGRVAEAVIFEETGEYDLEHEWQEYSIKFFAQVDIDGNVVKSEDVK